MKILIARFIANAITFFVVWQYTSKKMKQYEAQKYPLDKKQVIDNIKHDRRYDWGTGREENWKNTWNANNPIEKKKITIRGIIIKSFALYYFIGIITEIFMYAFMGIHS